MPNVAASTKDAPARRIASNKQAVDPPMHAEMSLPRPTTTPATPTSPTWTRLLLPVAALVTLAGYVGPWIPHAAAGLVVTGLDFAEYVKFLHPIRSGELSVWREGFYLPLVAVSLALSLNAYRRDLAYAWPIRLFLLGIAVVSALNLLPPAWSPAVLRNQEFRLQVFALVCCLGAVAIGPLLALLPRSILGLTSAVLSLAALIVPVLQFWRILPAIETIYAHAVTPGWGVWIMILGLLGLLAASLRISLKGSRT
ncbi:MAG: hypothetical protein KDD84_16065 [Caldilineaceae bacterium]|nr:hypothetical protein [Caldilineaceae bacterium]